MHFAASRRGSVDEEAREKRLADPQAPCLGIDADEVAVDDAIIRLERNAHRNPKRSPSRRAT